MHEYDHILCVCTPTRTITHVYARVSIEWDPTRMSPTPFNMSQPHPNMSHPLPQKVSPLTPTCHTHSHNMSRALTPTCYNLSHQHVPLPRPCMSTHPRNMHNSSTQPPPQHVTPVSANLTCPTSSPLHVTHIPQHASPPQKNVPPAAY